MPYIIYWKKKENQECKYVVLGYQFISKNVNKKIYFKLN